MWIPDQLYEEIKKVLPISCVDLIIENGVGEILFVKRKNDPAKGEWWFPGGRINFLETRRDAALRKLREECGLQGKIVKTLGTYDLIFENIANKPSHAITTVFQIKISNEHVNIDDQSTEYVWMTTDEIKKKNLNEFITRPLANIK